MDFSHSHIVNAMAEINIQSEDIGNGHPKNPHLRKVATHLTVIAHLHNKSCLVSGGQARQLC